MNPPRERGAVVAAWLEEGPHELPDATRRAIAVDLRTTHQSRRSVWFPWRYRAVDRLSLVALAAVAVMVVAIAGLAVSRIDPDGNLGDDPSEVPSASPTLAPASAAPSSAAPSSLAPASAAPSSAAPSFAAPSSGSPTVLVIPTMTQPYTSERHGYSMAIPADWSATSASQSWSPPAWKLAGTPSAPLDFMTDGNEPPWFRAGSAPLPQSLPDVNDWIDEFLIYGDPNCVPPREVQEPITIDGAPGRLWDDCGEVEATVLLEGRVYMFTLSIGSDEVTNGRELFDALAATIDLRPEDAVDP